MAWWRRDPSLWCRSPLHRYSRRVLRDHEALLRSRCFSKSQPTSAQHEDDKDPKRPPGLSNLEWMQLQQYRRWKKRLTDNPYHALFGASNDMLDGKGLKDWNWLYKAFPKWMLKEMDFPDYAERQTNGRGRDSQDLPPGSKGLYESPPPAESTTSEVYPKKVNLNAEYQPHERESVFKEPSFRSSKFERSDYASGVTSPSDSRRPREQIMGQAIDKDSISSRSQIKDATQEPKVDQTTIVPQTQPKTPSEGSSVVVNNSASSSSKHEESSRKETSARETMFIKEFLANSPTAVGNEPTRSDGWRQNSLDRRAAPSLSPKARKDGSSAILSHETLVATDKFKDNSIVTKPPADVTKSPVSEDQFWPAMSNRGRSPLQESTPLPMPNSQSSGEDLQSQPGTSKADVAITTSSDNEPVSSSPMATINPVVQNTRDANGWLIETSEEHIRPGHSLSGSAGVAETQSPEASRSASDILKQLPKEDIDFLSAEHIRASMGARKSAQSSLGKENKSRARLDEDFRSTHGEEKTLDPMLESKIRNDQQMRRTFRELGGKHKEPDSLSNAPPNPPSNSPATDSELETSLERMTKWLQASGDAFAKHFWSDPVQENESARIANGESIDPQLKAIMAGVKVMRKAVKSIQADLEAYLPVTKPLLKRLAENERNTIIACGLLFRGRRDSSIVESRPNHLKIVRKLRGDLIATEEEFEEAIKSLDRNLDISNQQTKPSGQMKDRLITASTILQKNAKLTRLKICGIQARLENPNSGELLPLFWDVGHRLLALQDTQLALARVVDRTLQLHGIDPKVEGDANQSGAAPNGLNTTSNKVGPKASTLRVEKHNSTLSHDIAATQKLEEEIRSQKSAMQGLSDDGYTRAPKPARKASFEEPNVLAHSLFRPFGLQLESLGKDVNDVAKPISESQLDIAFSKHQQSQQDRALVREVKKAYEDVYGPITVHHRQVEEGDTKTLDVKQEVVQDQQPVQSEEGAQASGQNVTAEKETTATEASTSSTQENDQSVDNAAQEYNVDLAANGNASVVESTKTSDIAPPVESSAISDNASAPVVTPDSEGGSSSTIAVPLSTNSIQETPDETPPQPPEILKTIIYDPVSDEISITTTFHSPTNDSTVTIPFHEAFAHLDNPAKFLPHLPKNFEVVAAKQYLLVLKESSDPKESYETEYVRFPNETEVRDEEWKRINPVDGTTRLSPTGFVGVGVDDLKEEVGREMEERRRMAEEQRRGRERTSEHQRGRSRREKRGGGVASVFKTAIVASAACYVVGVVGELYR